MNIGAIVFDTNAIKFLEDEHVRSRVMASLRIVDLGVRLSAVNVLELAKTKNVRVRKRLLRAADALSADRWILPLPGVLLRLAAENVAAGGTGFVPPMSGMEWIVRDPDRITEVHVAEATRSVEATDKIWESAHREARRVLRPLIRTRGGGDPWGSIEVFLAEQWTREEQLDTLISAVWRTLELPGVAPVRALLENEVWRLYFEAIGAVVYERSVPSQLPKPAHMPDVFQLVYLSGSSRRVLVTEDQGFARVANAVLRRRYSCSRVITPQELIAAAG